jgi:hypothetical protein
VSNRVTRRHLIGGGVVLLGAAAAGQYGRFALGDEFEEHVASVLGTSREVATLLTARVRERLGDFDYQVKATQFLAVTTFPGSELAKLKGREKGVREFVSHMIGDSVENLMYLGVQKPVDTPACTGLLRR